MVDGINQKKEKYYNGNDCFFKIKYPKDNINQ